jgi:hypothetical protein
MNATLTFNTVAFEESLAPKGFSGAFRQSSARGGYANPDVLSIDAQPYTDSATKVTGVRRTARIDGYYVSASGVRHDIAMYVVLAIPDVATSTDVGTVLTTFKAMVADANFLADVLNNER